MSRGNPYADFGNPVTGDRFIGRKEELSLIHSRIFGQGGYGSMAIIGLPRMGKTSLVDEAVRLAGPMLGERRAVVVQLDIGNFKSFHDLFRNLVIEILEKVRACQLTNELIELRCRSVLEAPSLSFNGVQRVFEALRQNNVRLVCIFDEFDAGRYLFADTPQLFHWLRNLGSKSEYKAALIIVSKRRLQDVARIAGHDSDYWANVLMTLTLPSFSESEQDNFFQRLGQTGVVVDDATRREVVTLCGGQPYLLDAFAFHAFEKSTRGEKINAGSVHTMLGSIVRKHFNEVLTILKDGPMLGKAIQVLVGPSWDVVLNDIETLLDYGVLKRYPNGKLGAFADAFAEYLNLVPLEVDSWLRWRDTERALREALEKCLQTKFGPSWLNSLKKSQPNMAATLLQACEAKMAKDQARFGSTAPGSLLAYTYPRDLYTIMATDWGKLGEPFLGKDKTAWSKKFELLSEVRTPLAHNREESVLPGKREQAEGICKEILERIRAWRESASEPT